MHLFILTDTELVYPSEVVFQKVLDIIELGKVSSHFQFYIVGNHLPITYQELYIANNNVTLLKIEQAEKLTAEIADVVVIHFGANFKGSSQFPHYFIPLSTPHLNLNSSWLSKRKKLTIFKNYLKKATAVFCINDWSIDSLSNQYPSFVKKMQEAWLPISLLPKLEWVDLCATRDELTQSNNYFLSFTPLDNLIPTLKEFSVFKKWQQTTMSLVFILHNNNQLEQARQILKGYKYQDSVVLKTLPALKIEWIAAAYTILLDEIDFDKTSIIEWAVHYDVPLLFNQNKLQPTSWLNAGEVFLFFEKNAISNHFKLYYKDEMFRQARVKIAKEWLVELTEHRNLNHFIKIPIDLKS